MKRVLILLISMMLCGACTGPVRQDDGGPPQRVSISSGYQNASAPRFEADLRPQKEQDLETIGRHH